VAIASFGETILGTPSEVSDAEKQIVDLQKQLKAMASEPTVPSWELQSVVNRLGQIQSTITVPSAVRSLQNQH
jgi:hypothetical protein